MSENNTATLHDALDALTLGEEPQIASTSQQSEETSCKFASIKDGLKRLYELEKERQYPMEINYFTEELQILRIGSEGFTSKVNVVIQELLLSSPTRIIVTGEAGYGKSALCKKLRHKWIEDAHYLPQFELVLLIRLKTVASTIEESIVQQCNEAMASNYKQREVIEYLKKLGGKLLLILDGYDQLRGNAQMSVEGILGCGESSEKTVLKSASVLMTTKLNKNEQIYQSFETILNICDLNVERRNSLIENYFKEKTVNPNSLIKNLQDSEMNLTHSPFLLYVMCYLHEQGTEFNGSDKFWNEYLILVRNLKNSTEVEDQLNEQEFEELVLKLGEIYIKHLERKVIEESEIQDKFGEKTPFVMSCGLLQKIFAVDDDSDMFKAPHPTLMAYLSRKYLSHALNNATGNVNDLNFLRELVQTKIARIKCKITKSFLSVSISLRSFEVEFVIEKKKGIMSTSAPVIRVNHVGPIPADDNRYCLQFSHDNREVGKAKLINHIISNIYPENEGRNRFMELVNILEPLTSENICLLMFWISHDCISKFCSAIDTMRKDLSLRRVKLHCNHSMDSCRDSMDAGRYRDKKECKVEKIFSALIKDRKIHIECTISHGLRVDQFNEFLLNPKEEKFFLKLDYYINGIHDQFRKDNETKLKEMVLKDMKTFVTFGQSQDNRILVERKYNIDSGTGTL